MRAVKYSKTDFANTRFIAIEFSYLNSETMGRTDVPSWLTVIPQGGNIGTPHRFRIKVAELNGDESRIGKVGFTVFNGSQSQTGSITITQHPCTLEDMTKTEQRAMKKYLSKFDVVDQLPAIADIQVGAVPILTTCIYTVPSEFNL